LSKSSIIIIIIIIMPYFYLNYPA